MSISDDKILVTEAESESTTLIEQVSPEVDAPEPGPQSPDIERALDDDQQAILEVAAKLPDAEIQAKSWKQAREVISDFSPVPWFIWRLSNFVFKTPGKVNVLSEGFLMGLKKLLLAAAEDKVLGSGEKIKTVRAALKAVPHDVIAAVSVIHSVARRLSGQQFERVWRPILEDAILRAHIGCYVGEIDPVFGAGRGMLAGFAGRAGLAILISSGSMEQAKDALESLASGEEISQVGLKVYECDPLQVSAMMLSASGCGRDAAFGTVAFAANNPLAVVQNEEQRKWLAAFVICENLRTGKIGRVDEQHWLALGFEGKQERKDLADGVKHLNRRGHGWTWLA